MSYSWWSGVSFKKIILILAVIRGPLRSYILLRQVIASWLDVKKVVVAIRKPKIVQIVTRSAEVPCR
jgi:hypothetical protein